MSDRALDLARVLVEEPGHFNFTEQGRIDPVSFRRFLDARFPGICQADVRRGVSIAVELVLLDGRKA